MTTAAGPSRARPLRARSQPSAAATQSASPSAPLPVWSPTKPARLEPVYCAP